MRNEDKAAFGKLLSEVMAGYGRPLPDGAMVNVWFNMLAPFEPATIRRAFDAYAAERPDFAPAPNSIAARCKLMDGRPDENEAWAIALSSRDERESVIWIDEMQEAFNLCRPVLDSGDEVGARMAFKDAYTRLVLAARVNNKPAHWSVSEGWDSERKSLVVARAVAAGLLPAPPEHLALAYQGDEKSGRPEGLERVLKALAQLEDPLEKAERLQAERLAAAELIDDARRQEIDRETREYLKQHPEARYGELLKGRQ